MRELKGASLKSVLVTERLPEIKLSCLKIRLLNAETFVNKRTTFYRELLMKEHFCNE